MLILLLLGCKKQEIGPQFQSDPLFSGAKVLILNEGNFGWGNASLSAYDNTNSSISNNVFSGINGGSLGDVSQSGIRLNDSYFLVINNSGKIVAIDTSTLELKGEISGLTSPRYLFALTNDKVYVSDLYSASVHIMSANSLTITGEIPVYDWVEKLIIANGDVYGTRPLASSLIRIDTASNLVLDTIPVGASPTSIVKDNAGLLWVLCAGNSSVPPSLVQLSPFSNSVLQTFTFPSTFNPSRLKINGAGDQLYFIDKGIYSLSTSATVLDTVPLVSGFGNTLYGFNVHPSTGELYVTDAEDYIQSGDVFRFTAAGVLIDSVKAGIIPQAVIF
ncbi:MAG: hypothetical protein JKY54_05785 [Flavobacteriales bacterium]|nr:hypothetical protein [Flavobacteriales bacterium]